MITYLYISISERYAMSYVWCMGDDIFLFVLKLIYIL